MRIARTYMDTKAEANSLVRKLRRANILSSFSSIRRGHVEMKIYIPHTMTDDDVRKMVANCTTASYEPLVFSEAE